MVPVGFGEINASEAYREGDLSLSRKGSVFLSATVKEERDQNKSTEYELLTSGKGWREDGAMEGGEHARKRNNRRLKEHRRVEFPRKKIAEKKREKRTSESLQSNSPAFLAIKAE